jgi:hypothetical protein
MNGTFEQESDEASFEASIGRPTATTFTLILAGLHADGTMHSIAACIILLEDRCVAL